MEYIWDLTRIFKDENEYNEAIKKVNELLEKTTSYKGRILENENTLLELLELDKKTDELLNKIYVYSYLGFYDNMGDVKFQQYKEIASSLMAKANSISSYIIPEILLSDFNVIEEYILKNKNLEIYKDSLQLDVFMIK